MVKKERGYVEKAHPDDIAIITRALFDEAERVAIELAHHAHDGSAFRAGRARQLCLGFIHAGLLRVLVF